MSRATSEEAYRAIKENGLLSCRRFQAYDALYRFGPLTAAECWRHCPGTQIDSIRPRMAELRRLGVVRETGRTKCSMTGMTVILWDVTSSLPFSDLKLARSARIKIEVKPAPMERLFK